jgi:hypothetical protein
MQKASLNRIFLEMVYEVYTAPIQDQIAVTPFDVRFDQANAREEV